MVVENDIERRRNRWKRGFGGSVYGQRMGGERRRREALERQMRARAQLTAAARQLAGCSDSENEREDDIAEVEDMDEHGMERGEETAMDGEDGERHTPMESDGTSSRRLAYARQLMQAEWLLDVPRDLASWLAIARPEGRQCLVVASRGRTVSRTKAGTILHSDFPSLLPGGSQVTACGGGSGYCILDCIYHERDETYYILDAMCWRGYLLYDCAADFRFFWLQTKLDELGAHSLDRVSDENRYRFVPLERAKIGTDAAGLNAIYATDTPYTRDGILLYNSEARYELGTSPLVLQWKDRTSLCDTTHLSRLCVSIYDHHSNQDDTTARYTVETDINGNVPEIQCIVLRLRDNLDLLTEDDPPVALGHLSRSLASRFETNALLRFEIGERGIQFANSDAHHAFETGVGDIFGALPNMKLRAVDLRLVGRASKRRVGADVFSKIIFQYLLRRHQYCISIDTLRRAAKASLVTSDPAEEEDDTRGADVDEDVEDSDFEVTETTAMA